MSKPTVRDIAKAIGLSPASVSRALKGVPGVNERNRQAVFAAADEMGYVYTYPSGDSGCNESNLIAIFVRDVQNPFYTDLIESCIEHLIDFGYQAIIVPCRRDYKDVLSNLTALPFRGAVLMEALNDPINYINEIRRLKYPIVLLLNRPTDGFDGSTVIQDNFQAGYTAARHLIELGHRCIAFLSGPRSAPALNDRLDGYWKALTNYGIPCSDDLVFEGDLTTRSGKTLARHFLSDETQMPDALICSNDLMAIGFMDEFRKNGRKVPEDISLMGFDDIMLSSFSGIDLTTMRQNSLDMGQRTAELLHRRITNPSSPAENVIFDPQLVVRNTTTQKLGKNG